MSSPREAVYDVLLSRQQRAIAAQRAAELQAEWEQYERDNRTADNAYRGGKTPGGRKTVAGR